MPAPGPAVDGSDGPSNPPHDTSLTTPLTTPHETLERCVGDVDEFASRHWGRCPLLHTHTHGADTFDDVFSLEALDDIVAHGARLPTIRMVADGIPVDPRRLCSPTRLGGRELDDVVDPVKVTARLAEGATLVLQSLHRTSAAVGDFVTRLQDELSHPVQANAYLTPPGEVGLAEHSDLHDVLAVQLHGSKRWWVDGIGDVTVRRGDVIYVPQGVRHRAEATTETSLHLTLGIIRVTARQAIGRILAADAELLDAPLPIGYRHRVRQTELRQCLDTAKETAIALLDAADTGLVADHERSRQLSRPPHAGRIVSTVLADRLDANTTIRWIAPETLAPTIDEIDNRLGHWDGPRGDDTGPMAPTHLSVRLSDRTLTVPAAATDALRMLSHGRPVRVGDLAGLDEASRVVLAGRLVRETACIIEPSG